MISLSHWGMFERFGTPNATTLAVFAEIEAENAERGNLVNSPSAVEAFTRQIEQTEPSYDSKYLHGHD